MHILYYIKSQIIKHKWVIFIKTRSLPIDLMECKIRLKMAQTGPQWPQNGPNCELVLLKLMNVYGSYNFSIVYR
jgi:hypothetical protein